MSRATSSDVNGIVVVDKPAGMTSHDVVDKARRLFRTKRVGHTGTLDPDATGVLVLCLGQATRLAEYLSASRKHYVTEVLFGVQTTTQDASGEITAVQEASHLTREAVCALLPAFRGTIQQIPPMVSARHHEGKRLYELAREGVTVERQAREIRIDLLELTNLLAPLPHPIATLEVTCSTGTYIRTLASDLGEAAGVGALMQSLRRTWVGAEESAAFTLSDAQTLEQLQARADEGTLAEIVLPLSSALRSWPRVRLNPPLMARVRNGQAVRLREIEDADRIHWPPESQQTPIAVVDEEGEVQAVARWETDRIQPVKVFAQS